jgi:mannose-6-phosphate isomerase-like protein (cupin superfamily)
LPETDEGRAQLFSGAVGAFTLRKAARYNELVKRLAYHPAMTMDEKNLGEALEREGFRHTYVWQDGPNTFYAEHVHGSETAHVILNGEMIVTMNGRAKSYCAGERCDVPAGAVHSARMGPRGCRYLIGER